MLILPEAKLHHEGDYDAELARETDRRRDVIIELGKHFRNVAYDLKVAAKQQKKNDGEVGYVDSFNACRPLQRNTCLRYTAQLIT